MTTKRLDLAEVYRLEAKRIIDARLQASTIHSSGDIRAAGGQVEIMVRNVIADRLPPRYRTTHGHILDYTGNVSSQQDVIIAENLAAKSLFQTSDGTEYVPYESVYAFGEVKSTYYKSDEPIQSFSTSLANIRTGLTRQTHTHHPFLTFMVFGSANGFDVSDVAEFYRETPHDRLPNFVCLLDQGTIFLARFERTGSDRLIPVTYHLASSSEVQVDEKNKWSFIQWGDEEDRAGPNLMFMHLALVQHLQECGQAIPNLFPYIMLSLNWDVGKIFP